MFFILTLPDGHRYSSQCSCFHLGYFKQDSVAPNFDHQPPPHFMLSLVSPPLGASSAPQQLWRRPGVSLAWGHGPGSGAGLGEGRRSHEGPRFLLGQMWPSALVTESRYEEEAPWEGLVMLVQGPLSPIRSDPHLLSRHLQLQPTKNLKSH